MFLEFYGAPFSLLTSFDSNWQFDLYIYFTLVVAILYTLGIGSRLLSIPLLILFASLTNFIPPLSHGVEFLIEVSLFWGGGSFRLNIDWHSDQGFQGRLSGIFHSFLTSASYFK